jgi:hypothetical protein
MELLLHVFIKAIPTSATLCCLLLASCSLDINISHSGSKTIDNPFLPTIGDFSLSSKLADAVLPTMARTEDLNGRYGYSIAISQDESTMVVGAPDDSSDAAGINSVLNAGAVFVYIKSGGIWVLQQKIIASGTNARGELDGFGQSVAISGDTIVVGAPYHSYDAIGANYFYGSGAAFVFKRTSGVWAQQQKIVGVGINSRAEYDNFGWSVAISGDTVSVGSPQHDADASGNVSGSVWDTGAVFIFKRSGVSWALEQKIIAQGVGGTLTSDQFGTSVAMDGDTIVVGTPGQDYDAAGINTAFTAGAAYIYTRTAAVWTVQQKIVATGVNARKQDDFFGASVAISGETIVVGSPNHDYRVAGTYNQNNCGAVFVYVRAAGTWSQQQKLSAWNGNGGWDFAHFGASVAIDGDSLVVGSPEDDLDETEANLGNSTGSAYTFTRAAGVWTQEQKLAGSGVNGRNDQDSFGTAVAVMGDLAVMGAKFHPYDEAGANSIYQAGAIFVQERVAGTWSLSQKKVANNNLGLRGASMGARYGTAVAISADESTMVIGAPKDDLDTAGGDPVIDAGAAYVYIKSGGSWVFQQKLVASGVNTRLSDDNFGQEVTISGDTIVIGAPKEDFDENGAMNRGDAGAAYVFVRSAGVWSFQQKLAADATGGRNFSDNFGQAISVDGNTVVIGAPNQDNDTVDGNDNQNNAGAAYVFVRSGTTWTLQQKVLGSGVNGRVADDNFGKSVAISGESIAVGAPGQDTNSAGVNSGEDGTGAVFIFTRAAGVWNLEQKIIASGTNGRVDYDSFGSSVAMDGDNIVVGAEAQAYDENGANYIEGAGAAYVFTRSASVWSLQQKLAGTGTNARSPWEGFAVDLDISGDAIIAGSNYHGFDADGANELQWAGAAYLFAREAGVWSTEKKLVGSGTNGRNGGDNFGTGVALSGNTLAVGAPNQWYNAVGAGLSSTAGAVYVYEK